MMEFIGVMPAVTTKFTADEKLDLDTFGRNIDFQIESGVTGLILAGTLGEASTLSDTEKFELLDFTVDRSNKKVPVLLNIAESTTRNAVSAASEAQKRGADGLMVLPPMRYKADKRETLEHFRAIARSTDLPVMVYNNPVDYGIEVTLDMFEVLLREPNVRAVKESTRDVTNVTRLRNAFGCDLRIMCGVDTLAMEELVMGADGWVAGLVSAFPRETVAIYNLIREKRLSEAKKIYRWFMPLLELDIHPKLVQYIKYAEALAGVGTEFVRAPRLKLEGEEREIVGNIIRESLNKRPQL